MDTTRFGSALRITPWPWTGSNLWAMGRIKGNMQTLSPVHRTWGIKCAPDRERDLLIAVWIQHREHSRECRVRVGILGITWRAEISVLS